MHECNICGMEFLTYAALGDHAMIVHDFHGGTPRVDVQDSPENDEYDQDLESTINEMTEVMIDRRDV